VSTGKVVLQDTGGQVGIGTATVVAGHLIDTGANGAFLSTAGTWTNASSRLFKEAFSRSMRARSGQGCWPCH
jgi:hypothetical protein